MAVSDASLRNIAAVRGLNSEGTPARIHAAASILQWLRDTRGDKPRSTNASHAHLIASASAMEASVDLLGAMMSKSAWTCSRGRPPPPPPLLAPPVPPSFGPGAEDRNVIPTQDARSVVPPLQLPDVPATTEDLAAVRPARPIVTVVGVPHLPPARVWCPLLSTTHGRHDRTRPVSSERRAKCCQHSLCGGGIDSRGSPLSPVVARSLSLAPALPSDVSRSTTLSCSVPPVSTARTSSNASSPPFGGKKPLDKTSAADGRSEGSGAGVSYEPSSAVWVL